MPKLHLGCGTNIREGYINLDNRVLPGVDVVRDVLRGLPFSDNTLDEIVSENFLEHIPQVEVVWMMNEMWRVLKPGGTMHHVIPQAGTMNRWQDPTHLSDWIPETFKYFEKGTYKNDYYGGDIKPWVLTSIEQVNSGMALDVKMAKPDD